MSAAADSANSRRLHLQRPGQTSRPLYENLRRIVHSHALATDAALAAVLVGLSTAWLVHTGSADWKRGLVQAALIAPLAWRRRNPGLVFAIIAAIGFAQWVLAYRLIADGSLLIALYTVAVHESRVRSLLASLLMEVGAIMAAIRWRPAATGPRSFLFLTATVVAALFVGLTVRSGSEYIGWLAERAERLEVERDQQASLGAAAERARIAREMHDIVAHSLSVVVTLADAATIVSPSDPARATEAMHQVSVVGRQALSDMRTLIGVLRTPMADADLSPVPTIAQLDDLLDGVRSTGLEVTIERLGEPFVLGAAVELTLYRIVQEALTNILKHARAGTVRVTLSFARPVVEVEVADDGSPLPSDVAGGETAPGHGIEGMRERAVLHGGTVRAGPLEGGGWGVSAVLTTAEGTVP